MLRMNKIEFSLNRNNIHTHLCKYKVFYASHSNEQTKKKAKTQREKNT